MVRKKKVQVNTLAAPVVWEAMGINEQLEVIINILCLCSDFGFFPTFKHLYHLLAHNLHCLLTHDPRQSASLGYNRLTSRPLTLPRRTKKCATHTRGPQPITMQGSQVSITCSTMSSVNFHFIYQHARSIDDHAVSCKVFIFNGIHNHPAVCALWLTASGHMSLQVSSVGIHWLHGESRLLSLTLQVF